MFYPNITLSEVTRHYQQTMHITKENNIYLLTCDHDKSYAIDKNITLKEIQDRVKNRKLIYRTGLHHPHPHIQNGTLLFNPNDINYHERESTSYNEKRKKYS